MQFYVYGLHERVYRWRFTNWLMAKPWPRENGWHYRTIYRSQREGFPPARELTETERNAIEHIMARGTMDRWYRAPAGPLTSAWRAITFPHVHPAEEYEDAERIADAPAGVA